MTVTTDTASITHSADGLTTEFPVSFYFLNESDLLVDLISSAGALTHLVLGSNYTVGGAGNQDGGSVTTLATYAAGSTLRIYRNVDATQLTEYQQNDAFPAKTTEKALDKLTMLIQQAIAATLNSLRFPLAEYGTDGTLPSKGQRAGQILGFNDQGNVTMIPLPASVGAGDLRNESWTNGVDFVAGTSNSVQLSRAYGTKANLGTVVMAGVGQDPASYDLYGNTLVFDDKIPLGVKRIWCVGGTTLSVYTPPDDVIKDALMYVNTSGQSIPNNTQTRVTAWTNRFDRLQKNFDGPSGTFVAPVGGFYRVSAAIEFKAAMPVNTLCSALLVMNGNEPSASTVAAGERFVQSASASAHQVQVSAIVQLDTGAYLNLAAFQNSGAAVALSTDAALNSFAVDRIV